MILHPDKEQKRGWKILTNRLLTLESDFNKVHNNKYNYTKSLYMGMAYKIEIICPIHGSFWQVPDSHFRGVGCSKCSDEIVKYKHQKPVEQVIKEFINIHGNLYDYTEYYKFYDGAFVKSNIICRTHGVFMQEPTAHKSGAGCPQCANEKSSFIKYKNKKTILYYIKINDLYKIGLTQSSVIKRFSKEIKEGVKIEIIKTLVFEDGVEALQLEQKILSTTQHLCVEKEDSPISGGWSEIRRECILETLNNIQKL